MDEFYNWIGFVVFWLLAVLGSVITIGFLLKTILNKVGKLCKSMWVVVEFAYYKKDFLVWVKDKKRHPKYE